MIDVIKDIRIDLVRRSRVRLIFATQSDVGCRKVIARIANDGKDISIDSGVIAHANFLRPDGESGAVICKTNADGSVEFTIPLWALSVVGEVKCSISLFDEDGSKVTSAQFSLDVEAELYSGEDILEDPDYPLIVSMMSTLAGYSSAEDNRNIAEKERIEAEKQRQAQMKLLEDNGVVIVSDDPPAYKGAHVWINPSADDEVLVLEDGDLAAIDVALGEIIDIQNSLIGGDEE